MQNGTPAAALKRARDKHAQRLLKDGTTGRVIGEIVDLNVPADDLDEGGVDIHEELPTAFMSTLLDDGHDVKWSGRAPSRLDVHLEKEAGFVRVKGTARFALLHPCVRCLTDVAFDVPLDIDLRMVAREKPLIFDEDSEADVEVDSVDATDLEDLDVASFSDGVVAFADTLREQLFLELPMHPACDSPRARVTQPCAFVAPKADPGWVDPRWAGLEALRNRLPAAPPPAAPTATALKQAAPKPAAPKQAPPKKAPPKSAAPKKAAAKAKKPAAKAAKAKAKPKKK